MATTLPRVNINCTTDHDRYTAILETRLSDKSLYRKELKSSSGHPSKERTALYAAVMAMKAIKKPCEIVYKADTPYLAHSYHRINSWRQNNWHSTKKQPIKNQDLWTALEQAVKASGSTVVFCYDKENIKEDK